MIVKELDPFQSEDKLAKSGRAAEEQMAFYLKRFFATDSDVLVLNGVRLEEDGDAAQIDHLLIHSYGLTIVESKSVHGKIQIKDDGQWIRWFGANQSKGIASPHSARSAGGNGACQIPQLPLPRHTGHCTHADTYLYPRHVYDCVRFWL